MAGGGHQPGMPPMVVEIGLKEIYDLLVALNTNVQIMSGDLKDLTKKADDHELRIRGLEEAHPKGRLERIERDVESLKAKSWPLPSAAILISLIGVGVTIALAI